LAFIGESKAAELKAQKSVVAITQSGEVIGYAFIPVAEPSNSELTRPVITNREIELNAWGQAVKRDNLRQLLPAEERAIERAQWMVRPSVADRVVFA
jgi:hypothetical protein